LISSDIGDKSRSEEITLGTSFIKERNG